MTKSTIINSEVEKFANFGNWWDYNGKFKTLHQINKIRTEYLVKNLDIKSRNLLDIGCGGGILTESLARIGANVTGIDPSEKNIKIASSHAKFSELNIKYEVTDIENFAQNCNTKFDIITCMEVVEHVDNLNLFLEILTSLVNDGGFIAISTINRTKMSFIKAILMAEYVLRWLPRGTHDWGKFIRPSELSSIMEGFNCELIDIKSMDFNMNFFNPDWVLGNSIDTNYIALFKKPR